MLSRTTAGWQRPTQLWLDPQGLSVADLAARVAEVRPLRRGLILGGTRVHDWFHAAGAIDSVALTVEPVRFGAGLPLFTGATGPAEATFADLGYGVISDRRLNATGTRLLTLEPKTDKGAHR